jgi:hypothetical protein
MSFPCIRSKDRIKDRLSLPLIHLLRITNRSGRIDFNEFKQWFRWEMERSGPDSAKMQQVRASNHTCRISLVYTDVAFSCFHQVLSKPSFLPIEERALLILMDQLRRVSGASTTF